MTSRRSLIIPYNADIALPTRAVTEQVLRSRLALLKTAGLGWKAVLDAAEGLSHAELTKA